MAQRQANAVGGGGADQRRAADQHGADRVRGLLERGEARRDESMRQCCLVDDADGPAVGLEPDAAHRLAVDFHDLPVADFFLLSMRISALLRVGGRLSVSGSLAGTSQRIKR